MVETIESSRDLAELPGIKRPLLQRHQNLAGVRGPGYARDPVQHEEELFSSEDTAALKGRQMLQHAARFAARRFRNTQPLPPHLHWTWGLENAVLRPNRSEPQAEARSCLEHVVMCSTAKTWLYAGLLPLIRGVSSTGWKLPC